MYQKVEKWLDQVFNQEIPSEVAAFGFNLYEDGDFSWSMEVVGTGCFDPEDEDWICDEITNFGTRESPFAWQEQAAWEEILKEMKSIVTEYLRHGAYASALKEKNGVGIGFVDGDTEILSFR